MIMWLKKKKCTFNWTSCAWAALGGHLEVLQYLRSIDCPWNKWITENAARHNHRDVFYWAISNGCPVSEDASRMAKVGGHNEFLKEMKEKKLPFDNNL